MQMQAGRPRVAAVVGHLETAGGDTVLAITTSRYHITGNFVPSCVLAWLHVVKHERGGYNVSVVRDEKGELIHQTRDAILCCEKKTPVRNKLVGETHMSNVNDTTPCPYPGRYEKTTRAIVEKYVYAEMNFEYDFIGIVFEVPIRWSEELREAACEAVRIIHELQRANKETTHKREEQNGDEGRPTKKSKKSKKSKKPEDGDYSDDDEPLLN